VSGADYSRQRPSATQRIVLRLMRKRATEIERSTREWILTCPHCGLERTLWDIGGVRWGHRRRGKPERVRMRCPRCQQQGNHPLERR
jgi:Zn finger protein HypA/HybF involved in hydrogenase expression